MAYELLTDKDKEKEPKCCYEYYDKDLKAMIQCGKDAHGKKGLSLKYPLCKEHFEFAERYIK